MLSRLTVRNLAVVEDLTLNFDTGMTSLTGETGAGKSILIDALGLVLGDRADSNMIRYKAQRAEIEAELNISTNPTLSDWLKQQELDEDEHCHLRRTINRDGRSKAYINGRSVQLAQLREVSERSIDIHGQHAHQSLLRPQTQRELLDTAADNLNLLKQLKTEYQAYQQAKQDLAELEQAIDQQTARGELLQYQVDELARLELTDEGIADLLQTQQQLANASQLMAAAQAGLHYLFNQDNGAAYDLINSSLQDIDKLQDAEPRFASAVELLNAAIINLDEAGAELKHYLDQAEVNPEKLNEIEEHLSLLHDLARKHHVEIEALPRLFNELSNELAGLSDMDARRVELQEMLADKESLCRDLCRTIRKRRLATARPLAEQISQTIRQLAIPAGRIEFDVSPAKEDKINETGADAVQILVATNPGQAAEELAKIASGGELARISLAIQVLTAGERTVPTLIFDEVDVGIGGSVAEIVGQHLRKLATIQQVICITHLPQVAAQAHHQLQVSKKHLSDTTHIEVLQLTASERIEEIARMLGGVQLTEKTRQHAEEMLQQAQFR